MATISSIAFSIRAASAATTRPIKTSHAQQLVAAALGYKSLAAFQASAEETGELDGEAHYFLDGKLLAKRCESLALPHDFSEIALLLEAAFRERLPAARLHMGGGSWDGYLHNLLQDRVLNDEDVSGAMATTNSDGIDEVYLPYDVELADLPPLGEVFEEEIVGHVAMSPDVDRPYSGHMIDVTVRLTIERKGRVAVAEPECEVLAAKLRYDWGDEDEHDSPATVSLAEALAEELGIDVGEAEELVDVEPLAVESEDGLLYRYVLDFTGHASPDVAEKLMAKHGSLEIEVSAWFFDRVTPEAAYR